MRRKILGLIVIGMILSFTHLAYMGFRPAEAHVSGDAIWTRTSNPSTRPDQAYDIAVDSTGLYVVGFDRSPGDNDGEWRIEKRSLTTGAITWTQTYNPSIINGDEVAYAVAVDSTGLYVAGGEFTGPSHSGILRIEKRSLTTGSVTWAQTEPSAYNSYASGVAVDSSGIYVVGSYLVGSYAWLIEKRSLTTGSIIWTQTSNPSTSSDAAYAVVVDSTGLYVVGVDVSLGATNYEWRIEKRNLTTGSSIWNQTENIGTCYDYARGVAVDSTGLYVVGNDCPPATTDGEWRIEKRNLSTGAIIWTKTSNPSTRADSAYDVAVGSAGLYVVGFDGTGGNSEWRIEKRKLGDGSIIWSQTENPSNFNDLARGIAVDSTGLYVVGYDSSLDESFEWNSEWRIEKRNLGFPRLILALQTPANRTVIDGTYQTLTVRVTSSSGGGFVTGGNVTIYVNGVAICTNKSASPAGLVSCSFQVTAPGTYYWNVTAQKTGDFDPAVAPQATSSFTVGMIQSIDLVAGWNLISLPLVPANALPNKVLAAQIAANDFSVVWAYQGGAWKFFKPPSTGTLTSMPDGLGYWIHMTQRDTLYLTGSVIQPTSTPPSYPLVSGWNLVGFKPQPNATEPKTVGAYLTSINASYDHANVWVYNNTGGTWIRADTNPSTGTMLRPGDAMWVLMSSPAILRP